MLLGFFESIYWFAEGSGTLISGRDSLSLKGSFMACEDCFSRKGYTFSWKLTSLDISIRRVLMSSNLNALCPAACLR